MFKNKHIIAALIIAPILSIMSYFAVDHMVSEKPHKAMIGNAYPLVEKPNCRYESGQCGLKNGEFQVDLTAENAGNGKLRLRLSSAHPLEHAGVAIVPSNTKERPPVLMTSQSQSATEWVAMVPYEGNTLNNQRLRIALSSQGTFYYAESSLAFIDYQTAYHQDFR
jgi:hypothetical protein